MSGRSRAGFTLVEMLVAIGLMALVMIALLNMLDTSTEVSKVEAALADTQENVRFAAYHLMRTARMSGGGEMPFARTDDDVWVVGRIEDDTGSADLTAIGMGNITDGAASSDILTLRGFFETAPFFTTHSDVDVSGRTVTIREHRVTGDNTSDVINPLDEVPSTNAYLGRGIVFMGMRQYAVGEITGSSISGTFGDGNRALTLNFAGGGLPWSVLSPDGAALGANEPDFNVYRVGVLQSYTYYVRDDFSMIRRRAANNVNGFIDEPVAVNIGALQVSIGLDSNNDGVTDAFNTAPNTAAVTANEVTSIRITVLGRTPFPVRDWSEPAATFQVPGDDFDVSAFDRRAKWRRMDVTAGLRNFSL